MSNVGFCPNVSYAQVVSKVDEVQRSKAETAIHSKSQLSEMDEFVPNFNSCLNKYRYDDTRSSQIFSLMNSTSLVERLLMPKGPGTSQGWTHPRQWFYSDNMHYNL